jgi:hypothetical protein
MPDATVEIVGQGSTPRPVSFTDLSHYFSSMKLYEDPILAAAAAKPAAAKFDFLEWIKQNQQTVLFTSAGLLLIALITRKR